MAARQVPSPGSEVGVRTEVTLYVSDGPPGELFTMMSLIGDTVKAARKRMGDAGLRVGRVRYEFTTTYEPGVVIRQVPESGEEVRQGSRVSLVISKL